MTQPGVKSSPVDGNNISSFGGRKVKRMQEKISGKGKRRKKERKKKKKKKEERQ